MLRFLSRPLVLAVLVTLLIWLVVIIYWQESARDVSGTDIATYMVGLPLLVIALGLGARYLYRRRSLAAPAAAVAQDGSATPASTDSDERSYSLALMTVGLVGGCGANGADILAALKENKTHAQPDPELRNREGFPVTTCRVPDLDTGGASTVLDAAGSSVADGITRGLALLEQAMTPVLDALTAAAPEEKPKAPAAGVSPRLLVDLLVPPTWDEPTRAAARRHLTALVAETGWPGELCDIHIVATPDGVEGLRRLDRFCLESNRSRSGDFYLLAACESSIDEDLIASLDASGQLFGVDASQGRVPGEGAVAVLVRASRGLAPDAVVMATMTRAAFRQRDKSADASGRIGHETLLETAQQCLEATAAKADEVGNVVSDIDQRASRAGECLGTMNALLPELDPAKQFVSVGVALGRLDVSGTLAALGVAASAVQAEEKPALLLVAAPAKERVAAVIKPFVAAVPATDTAAV